MSLLNEPKRRKSDQRPIVCRLTEIWDWIDKRDIDKHAVSLAVLWGTVKITGWAMDFATVSGRPGLEVAAIIGAVGGPYMALQAAAIAFYFKARQ